MIGILGDVHGDVKVLRWAHEEAKRRGLAAVLQVGDCGFYASRWAELEALDFEIPLYAIRGNHEQGELILHMTSPTPIGRNFVYVPDGMVLTIDGRRIGFLGGAASVDKDYRIKRGIHWCPREQTREVDVERLIALAGSEPLDLLITHCPPQRIIQRHFDPNDLERYFGLDPSWRDPSADLVEQAWDRLGKPQLVCGHMHRKVIDDEGVRILGIDELMEF